MERVSRLIFRARNKADSNAASVNGKLRLTREKEPEGVVFVEKGKVTRSLAAYDPEGVSMQMDADMLSRRLYTLLLDSIDAPSPASALALTRRIDPDGLSFMVENTLQHPIYFNVFKISSTDGSVTISELGQPVGSYIRPNTYALVIGNQNYRFVSDVPYAIHDARVFAEYCKKTLGIPVENIHITEDATKQMILEEEIQDWIKNIPDPESKQLIVYYAGHGVPDTKNQNKAYLLPTDVRGTNPSRGIALDEFYSTLGDMAFNQTTVFIDACFSGVNRENEGVTEGLRAVEIDAEDTEVGDGNIVVFSAAQGNETAQGLPEEGHGLFTYYLLQVLNSTAGYTTLGALSDHIEQGVTYRAPQLKLKKKQTPTTNASTRMGENWRMLRL